MAVARQRFRPMGLGDILDEAFDLYKNNFALLVGIGALIYAPFYFMYGYATGPALADLSKMFSGPAGTQPGSAQPFGEFGGLMVILFLLAGPAYAVVTGAFMYAMSQRYVGEPTTIGGSYGFVARKLGALIWTLVLLGLAVMGVFIGLVVVLVIVGAGLVFASGHGPTGAVVMVIFMVAAYVVGLLLAALLSVRMFLGIPALLLEGIGGFAALRRGWDLSRGHSFRIVLTMILTWLVVGIIGMIATYSMGALVIVSTLKNGVAAGAAMGVVMAIVETLLAPVSSIVVVLLYYDLRVRKEGFDLQMLARDLAVAAGGSAPDSYQAAGASTPSAAPPEAEKATCNYCRFWIGEPQDKVACPSCQAIYHKSCWQEHGGCSNPGCPAAPAGAAQT